MTDFPSILFVCTANLCRSPMAETLFSNLLDQKLAEESRQWKIGSAGTWAEEGRPASKAAQIILSNQFGLSLSKHLSRQISAELMNDYNLILVMEKGQKEALQIEFPWRSDRIFLLSEMVGATFEIDDPIGGEITAYLKTAQQIKNLLAQGWNKILSLSQNA